MGFLERLKGILLEKNNQELLSIDMKLEELEKVYSEESQDVQVLKEESIEASKEKSKVQSGLISKSELSDLDIIYKFILTYPRIESLLNVLEDMRENRKEHYVFIFNDEDVFDEELNRRVELTRSLRELNEKVKNINTQELAVVIKENEERRRAFEKKKKRIQDDLSYDENDGDTAKKSGGFFSRIFRRKKKQIVKQEEQDERKETETSIDIDEKLFGKYKKTIYDFYQYYNSFITVDFEEPCVVDKLTCTRILTNIGQILANQKRWGELYEDEEAYLNDMQPHDLWREISKYYINILDMTTAVQNFEKDIIKFEEMYRKNPNLFDLEYLERIFKENSQMIADLRSKTKVATDKTNEFTRKKESEKSKREKINGLKGKKKALIEKRKRIEKAKSLNELGYKSKADAAKKLSIEIKDYIVIPISNEITNISDLFKDENKITIDINGNRFYSTYVNDTALGFINTVETVKGYDSVLMVPIKELKKEQIDSVKDKKVSLNSSVLSLDGVIALAPNGRYLNLGESNVTLKGYSYGTIREQVEMFLGDDFVSVPGEIENYEILKGIPSTSSAEKKAKKEVVKKCLFECLTDDIKSTDIILVNGKNLFLNKEDIDLLKYSSKEEMLDEEFLTQIADEIEEFLIEDTNHGPKVDEFYKRLLLEYFRVNKKAKADYYDEENSKVNINGKKLSIKPILPSNDDKIANNYTRSREDVVYKMMKLASLVNRFAHLTDNEELQNSLFEVKSDLIERVIDLSKDNPNINIRKKFDSNKMVLSVALEIPKYNMIALHLMNKSNSLTRKSNRLDELEDDVLQTSIIQIPGVNKELLNTLKGLSEEERMKLFANMESDIFRKLIIRMGYCADTIKTDKERKSFIKKIVSDKKISELLKENEDIYR